MATRVRTVNFGTTKAGLSTVGFRLYSYANSVFTADGARSTAGVDEIIASTGIYGAAIDIADRYHGVLIWDTGEATPRYGVDSLDDIYLAADSDTLRIIRNTIQNQANFEAEILNRLKTNSLDPNDPTLSTLRSAIERIDQPLVGPDRLLAMFGDAAAIAQGADTDDVTASRPYRLDNFLHGTARGEHVFDHEHTLVLDELVVAALDDEAVIAGLVGVHREHLMGSFVAEVMRCPLGKDDAADRRSDDDFHVVVDEAVGDHPAEPGRFPDVRVQRVLVDVR